MFSSKILQKYDPEIASVLEQELQRQEEHIELIASENYVSPAVLAAQGSILTNKYAEGYPGKRYYGGCEFVDKAEKLALDRVKKLFGAAFANVQAHSGSSANLSVYFALLKPGDTILGMDLSAGGHLTHGSPANFSGKLFHAQTYGVDPKTGLINYDEVEQKAKTYRPKLIIAGFSAYSRIVDWARIRAIADSVGAYFLADMAHVAGLIAVGLYPSPVQIADVTTSTTHKTLRGPRGGLILARANNDIEKKLNAMIFPGTQGGPLMHIIAAKAVAFKEALQPEFRVYQQQVINNAKAMADVFTKRGYDIVSGGTDNHLFLISLLSKNLTGKEANDALEAAYIVANKNSVPNDTNSFFITGGLRMGTPAVTTRGMKEAEVIRIANCCCDILDDIKNQSLQEKIRTEMKTLCGNFPVYKSS
ncbi:MAG: serine hydroxymethyltransferase [Gammaproteobacteria bacterium RIFCSPLOWO2_02_FULL_38_11]|nr:MAG: serine hydroxymethyltransferase [Gammaproteobacteria bacterium RIFCSPLOWO2_02_FULL_38_11]